ncbi:hypothetical protein ACIQBJ_06875 [Kitasatospora sp. NPDC088391]
MIDTTPTPEPADATAPEINEEISDGDLDAIGGGDGGQPTYPPYV